MGLFGKLFGGGKPRKPPAWARDAFGNDGTRFDAFVDVVCAVAADADHSINDDDVRTGSVILDVDGHRHEWILEDVAASCARRDLADWRSIVERSAPFGDASSRDTGAGDGDGDGNGDDGRDRDDTAEGSPTGKAWVIGSAAWGGVLLEAGEASAVMVVLPIVDRAPFAEIPQFPPGLVAAIIVCNGGDAGHLAGTALADAAGLDEVFAIDPTKPIDRGESSAGDDDDDDDDDDNDQGDDDDDDEEIEIDVLPLTKLEVRLLRIEQRGRAVIGRWPDGKTVIVGDAIPMSLISEVKPVHAVGKVVVDDADGASLVTAFARMQRMLVVANVPGLEATAIAKMMSTMGVTTEIAHGAAPVITRRMQVLAHMLAGDLDRADAVAVEGIAIGDGAEDMHHQRAMIALMRGDEAAADAELALIDTPQAMTSRAILASKRGDPAARDLAKRAVDRLPGDAIAIRTAVSIHIFADDRAGASALVADHGKHLDPETRVGLERAIADPPATTIDRSHTFPEHARLALEAITPMIDEGRLAEAETLLRRIRMWDPGNYSITAELGVALARQDKLVDAVAVYDESIARGGSAVLLRFNRGNCRIKLGFLDDAAADFRACLAIKPDWDDARVNLAAVEQLIAAR